MAAVPARGRKRTLVRIVQRVEGVRRRSQLGTYLAKLLHGIGAW